MKISFTRVCTPTLALAKAITIYRKKTASKRGSRAQGFASFQCSKQIFRVASTNFKLNHLILTPKQNGREGELRTYPAGPKSKTRGGGTRRSRDGRSRRVAPHRPQAKRGSRPRLTGHRGRLPQRWPSCSCSGWRRQGLGFARSRDEDGKPNEGAKGGERS
jgi:hypothetical protein